MNHDYTIKAFYPPNKGGGLAIHTWHIGTGSRDVEIAVFRERMARGEIDHIEVDVARRTVWNGDLLQMTLMHKCEACDQPIPQKQFVELSLRVLWSERDYGQDPVEEVRGDYCDGCVASGKAVDALVGGLARYKRLEK